MRDAPSPGPLLFEPILKEKVWGGRRLETLGKALPAGARVGESWELADLDATSPTGGGGAAAHSVVRAGPMAGRSIRAVMDAWGAGLMGAAQPTPGGAFPLLIKFLDAAENLSVQVHPSPAFAAAHADAHLKHEAWCVIAAAPGSVIYRGLKPGVTRDEMARRVREGTVVEALRAVPATPGEILDLPSGVVHALGGGVLVAEVQTASDTTFRLDDWGRTGRALHIEAALASAFDGRGAQTVPAAALPPATRTRISTEAFTITRIEIETGASAAAHSGGASPSVVMLHGGAGDLRSTSGAFEPVPITIGDTALVPAACRDAELRARDACVFLRVTLPTVGEDPH